jgi:hypothetical protein
VTFPRIVLAEFNTHRVLSRNSASSRAIPIAKRIEMVEQTPYVPDEFGSNQKGMQSGAPLEDEDAAGAREDWLNAARIAVVQAQKLQARGVHKEYANRLLEPFCWHTVIVTATEWENFRALRCHPLATRPIRLAAELMFQAYDMSTPRTLAYGDWHLPYVSADDEGESVGTLVKLSAARCARVSYLTQGGVRDPREDLALYARLRGPGHMSPLEHPARPAKIPDDYAIAWARVNDVAGGFQLGRALTAEQLWFGNFRGWVQHRKEVPGEAVFVPPVEGAA